MYPETPGLFKELMPYGGQLDMDNFWIKLSQIVPWDRLKVMYNGSDTILKY